MAYTKSLGTQVDERLDEATTEINKLRDEERPLREKVRELQNIINTHDLEMADLKRQLAEKPRLYSDVQEISKLQQDLALADSTERSLRAELDSERERVRQVTIGVMSVLNSVRT